MYAIRLEKRSLIGEIFDGEEVDEIKRRLHRLFWLGYPGAEVYPLVEDPQDAMKFREQHAAEYAAEEFFISGARFGERFKVELVDLSTMTVVRTYAHIFDDCGGVGIGPG
jgi:hypothetical protein